MPTVYDEENFSGRVNFAAKYISEGRNTTRHFDTCFEMYDGDAVYVALCRRAMKNPKLAENMPRYLCMSMREKLLEQYTHITTRKLPEIARQLRNKATQNNI